MKSIQQAKEQNKKHYDKGSKDLPKLQPRDSVRIQMGGEWIPGTVKRLAGTPRSYIVEGPGGREYQRNRRHLRKAPQFPITSGVDDDNDDTTTQPAEQETVEQPDSPPPPGVTSSGRTIRVPSRYQDFVSH